MDVSQSSKVAAMGGGAPQLQRMIVRSASLSIVVADTTKALEKVTATADAFGGYVSHSKVWRDAELLRGTVSFRVPADKLAPALAAIRGAAVRVQSESLTSEEVTEEFVDLEARLRTLQATETELKELMTVMRERSRKASEVLEMHQQLMNIRTEIERITGRIRYLQGMTTFASAHVDLIPDAIAQPVVEPGWQPVVVAKSAGRALVKALQHLTDMTIWVLILFVPIGLMLFFVTRAITLMLRMRRSASS
jgi:Rad3-related DNA helicase